MGCSHPHIHSCILLVCGWQTAAPHHQWHHTTHHSHWLAGRQRPFVYFLYSQAGKRFRVSAGWLLVCRSLVCPCVFSSSLPVYSRVSTDWLSQSTAITELVPIVSVCVQGEAVCVF
mmetsp:Transcript_5665/g.13508  ORF Transcript_5665/g.13508 Transcript_5665/m.13508 type:complete len:116 (-) Transcript_5665:90-437(-)